MKDNTIRISFAEMQNVLYTLFLKHHFQEERARLLTSTFSENSLAGVNSHGLNRVPRFIDYVERGFVKTDAEAKKVASFGSIERWDGQLGPGIINAIKCTDRATELAKQHGMGLVALRNTNHWMRGGSYGWQAAKAGCIALMFTNTTPNMPPWGGKESRLGNNPLIVAIPRAEGHVVLDMAVSQYSFGKINDYQLRGEELPYYGGWDEEGQLSKDPEKIMASERSLPIGYWKGSALSMILDVLATLLSAGDSTYRIGTKEVEYGISQIYLCIYPEVFGDTDLQQKLLTEIIDYTREVEPLHPGSEVYYPGQRSAAARKHNLEKGIAVDVRVWEEVVELSS